MGRSGRSGRPVRPGRPALVAFPSVTLALVAAAGFSACGTVELGSPPADVNACRPSEKFFAQKIWPEFLDKDYGGKHCHNAGCHGAGSARVMVLAVPGSLPGVPLTPEWAAVYQSVTEQMLCTSASASPLLERPSNANHGGGKLIDLDGPEAALVRMWVTAP